VRLRDVPPQALAAALLFFAYPPASLVVPSFCALVPFLWILEQDAQAAQGAQAAQDHPRGLRAFLRGYWFGVWANGVVMYWIVVALFHFTPLSAVGYVAAVGIVLAPMWGIVSWAYLRVRTRTTIPAWVAFPLIWTAVEFLQAHLSDVRFPWLGLGTSLVRVPVLAQWADLAGARGVTLWLAWASVMVYVALRDRKRAWRPLGLLAASIVLAFGYGTWRERTLVTRPVMTVAVIQPNIGFNEKRQDRERDTLALQMLALTRQAEQLPGVRLVAWPEAVLEGYFINKPDWPRWIGAVARETNVPILAGGLDVDVYPDGTFDYYNAAFLFDTTGSYTNQPSYRKTYLVPIVERVPFLNPRWFGDLKWFGGFGHGKRFPVYQIHEGRFGVVICYESAFEDLARDYRRRGADFMVNITNDSWFGRTAAPYQHASHLQMRAIETRMGIARAAITGISEFVDPLGYVHGATALDVLHVEADVVRTTDGRTLYVRLGDWVALLASVGTLACLVASQLRKHPSGATA
jgi:apolipoprotein N-acyltransferase